MRKQINFMSMKLYHYTSVDVLELILKNRTIKFNRLDQVDDLNEKEFTSGLIGTQLGLYTFAACFSKSSKESIPMWNMYAKWNSGVRIGIMKDMFNNYKHYLDAGFVKGPLETIIADKSEILGKDYIVAPVPLSEMYVEVIYTDDSQKLISKAIPTDGKSFKFPEIGKYKITEWDFQYEIKFRIHVFPLDMSLIGKGADEEIIFKPMRENREISKTCFYVPLKDIAIDNMEIMIGPNASCEDRERIVELAKEYCTNATIINSKLTGMIRTKI